MPTTTVMSVVGSNKVQGYMFQNAYQVPEEVERLDDLHKGITGYFGGRLTQVSLDADPKSILELGSGSGAWAIQAAQEYPDARVLAVDISPLPDRPLPKNLKFEQADITTVPLFTKERFDLVHCRLVMMHVPNGSEVLKRVIDLVAPGGWFIIEEPDDDNTRNDADTTSESWSTYVSTWLGILRGRGSNPAIGKELESILASSGRFSEVFSKKVAIPLCGQSSDARENVLGGAWRVNIKRLATVLPERYSSQGITKELVKSALDDIDREESKITTDMYFVWARRRAE